MVNIHRNLPCILLILLAGTLQACHVLQTDEAEADPAYTIDAEPVDIDIPAYYKGSSEKKFHLLHTRLDLTPEWETQTLSGNAILTLTPGFYPQDSLHLDAKGMSIKNVRLLTDSLPLSLKYSYNRLTLSIALPETKKKGDTFEVSVAYQARPYDRDAWHKNSPERDIGLRFVNPLGDEEGVPRQVWTQGQPQATSSWHPTLDAPNQRSTQETFITVDREMKTLTNGTLLYSSFNPGGTRTDF